MEATPKLDPTTPEPEGWRDPKVLKLGLGLAFFVTMLVAILSPSLSLHSHAGHHTGAPPVATNPTMQPIVPARPSANPTLVQVKGQPRWFMCSGFSECGMVRMERWTTSPALLAGNVGALTSLPGVDVAVFSPVAQHWTASPPSFKGSPMPLSEVAAFIKDLLSSDPFAAGDSVPFVDFRPPGEGKVVAISQRQLAFLVANVLMGNTIPVGDGLTAAVKRCIAHPGGKHSFLYSLLSFLAVLSRELSSGAHGSMLVGATPRAANDSWRQRLASSSLAEPKICTHQGGPGATTDCGEPDFMSAGTPFQAVTDIAGGVVGGGAQLCDVADSQDESLVQFYSEVLAFSFFTAAGSSPAAENSMLPVPFVLLGARRYVRDVSGESSQGGSCGSIQQQDWLNEDITHGAVAANVDGRPATLAASAFVAVASACSGCLAGSSCDLTANVNNQCDMQRRHLDRDVSLWYQAYEPTMYATPVQEAFSRVIRRIGTGPWGAGVWYGDSQQYFLAVWLATSSQGSLSGLLHLRPLL